MSNFLPPKLKIISISGLEVQKQLLLEKYPELQFIDAQKPAQQKRENEVERNLHVDAVKAQIQFLQSESTSKSVPKAIPKTEKVVKKTLKEPVKVIKKIPQKVIVTEIDNQKAQTAQEEKQIDNVQNILNDGYQKVLNEINQMQIDNFNSKIDQIIKQSQNRILQYKWEGAVEGIEGVQESQSIDYKKEIEILNELDEELNELEAE